MKLKKAILLFGAVCILNIAAVGCGSVAETAAKTEKSRQMKYRRKEEMTFR